MRKFLMTVCMLYFLSAAAQLTKDDINLIQSVYGKDKRDIMQEYVKIEDASSATAFWKLYDQYEAERKKLGQDYIKIVEEYTSSYEVLNDKKADDLITRASANNTAFENLCMKYFKQMKPVVGALKASQFFQLEAYLRSAIKVMMYDKIPFIGEIDRNKKQTE